MFPRAAREAQFARLTRYPLAAPLAKATAALPLTLSLPPSPRPRHPRAQQHESGERPWIRNAVATWIAQYAQMAEQLQQQYQQLKTALSQLDQAKQELASLTGDRGLANILTENYGQISPGSSSDALNIINGSGQTSTLAQQYASSASLLGSSAFAGMSSSTVSSLQQLLDDAASKEGAASSVYQAAVARYSRLDDLRAQIQCAEDMKAISELQARIQAEQTDAQNELVKLMALRQLLDSKTEVQQETVRQQVSLMLNTAY